MINIAHYHSGTPGCDEQHFKISFAVIKNPCINLIIVLLKLEIVCFLFGFL